MSNEFHKFVAGLRLQARAADSLGYGTGVAWRGNEVAAELPTPARTLRARRLRAFK